MEAAAARALASTAGTGQPGGGSPQQQQQQQPGTSPGIFMLQQHALDEGYGAEGPEALGGPGGPSGGVPHYPPPIPGMGPGANLDQQLLALQLQLAQEVEAARMGIATPGSTPSSGTGAFGMSGRGARAAEAAGAGLPAIFRKALPLLASPSAFLGEGPLPPELAALVPAGYIPGELAGLAGGWAVG